MTLEFSTSLYREDAIREAAAVYGGLATISVNADGHFVSVTLTDVSPDLDSDTARDLADHFANHALHLSITSARRAVEGAQ